VGHEVLEFKAEGMINAVFCLMIFGVLDVNSFGQRVMSYCSFGCE